MYFVLLVHFFNTENYHYVKDTQQNIKAIVKGYDIIYTYDNDSFGHALCELF